MLLQPTPALCEPLISSERGLYVQQRWDIESGLPHNRINALLEDDEGYLWIGTAAGIAVFDGIDFKIYDRWNTPSLQVDVITTLMEDDNGTIWAGSEGGGVNFLSECGWASLQTGGIFKSGHIRVITRDSEGSLWIGTDYGLYSVTNSGVSSFGLDEGMADNIVTSLSAGVEGRLWAGTLRGGLSLFDEGFVQNYDSDDGLCAASVTALIQDPLKRLWIGTMRGGIYRLEHDEKEIKPLTALPGDPVTALAYDPLRGLIAGTMTNGVMIVPEEGPFTEPLTGTLADCHVRSVETSVDGSIWIGTDSRGLVRLKKRTAFGFTARDGLPRGRVTALLEDSRGWIWAGTERRGLFRIKDLWTAVAVDTILEYIDENILALAEAPGGGIFVGSDAGLTILPNNIADEASPVRGLSSDTVTAILADRVDTAWIGTARGLNRMTGRVMASKIYLSGHHIRTLYRGPDGELYVGTKKGLWKSSGPSFTKVAPRAGEGDLDILCVRRGLEGSLWIGTNGRGLRYLHDGVEKELSKEDGLPSNFIFSISEDVSGRFAVSSDAGVFIISPDSLLSFIEGYSYLLTPYLVDRHEGMPSSNCSGSCFPAYCDSRSGRKLYPTSGGIAALTAASSPEASKAPVPVITSVLLNGEPVESKDHLEVKGGTSRIKINFTALHCASPEKCRFLYRMEGDQGKNFPIHPGEPRAAEFNGLGPGSYRFTVKAIANGAIWSEKPGSLRITVHPPFYATGRFFGAILSFLAAGGAGGVYLKKKRERMRRLRKYSTSPIDEKRVEDVLKKLEVLVKKEKAYLDPDLTLKKLASKIGIHYNHLSRIINERFGLSFSDFVNEYRIEEAKSTLRDPGQADRTILDIMYGSGFYSKSTFNTAFKKFTGLTPSKYRKNPNHPTRRAP